MNNKEYGVKLDVDISKFTSKLTSAKTYTDQVMSEIKDRIKEPMEEVGKASKQSFTGRLETVGELSAQLSKLIIDYANIVAVEGKQSQSAVDLKEKIRALKQEIEGEGNALEKIGDDLSDLFEDEQDATSGMKELGDEVVKTKNKGQGVSIVFARFGDDVSKSINKGISSIKSFTLSLLGIRGAYSVLTRAANAYMAQDKDMHTRLQANWIALGAMLAPIIEKLITLFQRLVAYINIFVKAFTGGKVDLLSKAMKVVEKNTKGTTKAVKSLNKELATMDEITNLNFDQGNSGGGFDDGGGFDISDALNEIANLQLDPKIVEIMNWLGTKLREVWDWCEKVYKKLGDWGISLEDVIKFIGVIFAAKEVGRIVSAIAKIIGVSGGTAGLYGMITALGIIDVYLAKTLIDDLDKLGKTWEQQRRAQRSLGDSRIETMYTVYDRIEEINDLIDKGITKDENGNDLEKEKTRLIKEAQKSYVEFNKEANKGYEFTQGQVDEMNEMRRKLEKLTNNKWEFNFWATLHPEKFKTGLMGVANWLSDWADKINPFTKHWGTGDGGSGFAKGNVAYEPTYAQFGEYAGARSNPEITAPQNMMRETLFEALTDALPLVNNNSGGDTILYVNGKELARATYQDYQAEGSRIGNSNVAVRRIS